MRTEIHRYIPEDVELVHPITKEKVVVRRGWKILSRTEWYDPNCKHQGAEKALCYRDSTLPACLDNEPCLESDNNWTAWEEAGGVRDFSARGSCDKGNAWRDAQDPKPKLAYACRKHNKNSRGETRFELTRGSRTGKCFFQKNYVHTKNVL